MKDNSVIQTMLNRRSIRKYTDEIPSDELVETIISAGQHAPFAYQGYSILLSRDRNKNPYKAPLLFTICADYYKLERIMAKRDWEMATNDRELVMAGILDAALVAENMVVAGESLGLGSCFYGVTMYRADKIAEEYGLPERILPVIQLVMGYPAENPPVRPRFHKEFVLFEKEYKIDEDTIEKAMKIMDDGFLKEGYYRQRYKYPLIGDRKEMFRNSTYTWTENISRKLGQRYSNPKKLLEQLKKRGFHIDDERQG